MYMISEAAGKDVAWEAGGRGPTEPWQSSRGFARTRRLGAGSRLRGRDRTRVSTSMDWITILDERIRCAEVRVRGEGKREGSLLKTLRPVGYRGRTRALQRKVAERLPFGIAREV